MAIDDRGRVEDLAYLFDPTLDGCQFIFGNVVFTAAFVFARLLMLLDPFGDQGAAHGDQFLKFGFERLFSGGRENDRRRHGMFLGSGAAGERNC